MPTPAEIEIIQADCIADDVPIIDGMQAWSEIAVRTYFESGGTEKPALLPPAPPTAPPAPAAPAAPPAPAPTQEDELPAFLAGCDLPALADTLSGATLAILLEILNDKGRTGIMDHLKSAGVTKPPERQKLAKALTTRARGEGVPVMVCFFSGGMTTAQGHDLLKQWKDAAAEQLGLTDQVVLPHIAEPGETDESLEWDDYIRLCERKVDEDAARRGRPVVIVAHSHGAVAAYSLARRMGLRVLKLCVACRRPPDGALLDEVLGVDCGAKLASYDPRKLIGQFHAAWSNPVLEMHAGTPPSGWPPSIVELVEVIKRQYLNTPGGSADVHLAVGPVIDAARGARKPIAAPIFAVASGQEATLGETHEKMEGWRRLTTGGCELHKVDASHMNTMKFGQGGTFDLLVKALKPIVEPLVAAEKTRKQLEAMGN